MIELFTRSICVCVGLNFIFFTYFPTRADEFRRFPALSGFWCGFSGSLGLWRLGFACFLLDGVLAVFFLFARADIL